MEFHHEKMAVAGRQAVKIGGMGVRNFKKIFTHLFLQALLLGGSCQPKPCLGKAPLPSLLSFAFSSLSPPSSFPAFSPGKIKACKNVLSVRSTATGFFSFASLWSLGKSAWRHGSLPSHSPEKRVEKSEEGENL